MFCHLHLHNEYSVLDGVGTSKQYAKLAKELGQTACALTNHGNIDGAIEHQKQCLEAGIIPIIGAEMYMVPDITIKTKGETRYHITLLVENQTGWRNLLQLLTIANIEGYYNRPRIDHKTLMQHIEGLVIMSACSMSFLHHITHIGMLSDYIDAIGKDRVYLEIMPHLIPEQNETNKLALSVAKTLGLQIVATNDCHYPTNEATKHQEVLLAIQSKKKWDDPTRWKFNCDGLFLRSEEEMVEAFQKQGVLSDDEIKKAIRRTMKIAKICGDFRIQQQEVYLPSLNKFMSEQDEIDYLRMRIWRGMRRRLKNKTKDEMVLYRERIELEMKLIISKKFVRYFLIVWDLIIWCQQNNIMTGPGRGSVGGCLVAYLLGITDCDPLIYGTEFFRFIDESRPDLPDIDMDFEDVRRDEARKYLSDKYGEYNVVGLSNFLTMKGKGVLRDVSRTFNVPLPEVNFAAKAMVEADEGQEIAKSFAEVGECIRFGKKYPEVVEIAQSIEGQIRGCLSGDCRLLLPNGDGRIKVKKICKLYESKYRGKVRAYDLTKEILFFDDIVDIWQTGVKKVYDLKTTYGGRTIRLTADHKLLTKDGWKEASKIKIGEFVATNGIPWNKGLTKSDHPGVMVHSKRMSKNNPAKLDHVKKQVSERSFKHGKFSIPPKYKTEHPICEVCGISETKEVHHIDLDSYNNDEENLLATCIDCHHKIHWSLSDQDLYKINPLRTIGWSKVVSFEYVGEEMTYDIEMKSSNQNFVCNKIITHNCGQHAAAVCISQSDLREGHNCNLVSRAGTIVANWDMRNAEYCGLMKLDILGLSALTILNECRRMVKQNHGIDINYKAITFDDPEVFAEISEGNTVGAFQIGSNGLTNYCKELGVENFAMLYAVTALWRPGPMQSGMTESYSKRKRGKEKVEKIHPIFDAITKETFGLIVYQEQVMKVVNQLAGISMATCNKIRKVIGKSMGNAAFDKYKEEFLQGCKNQGTVPEKKAIQIWDMMSKFGGYGFNLSHSVEYSMITYWDMYCVDGTTKIWNGDTGEFTTVSKAFKTGLSSTLCYDENTKKTKLGKVKAVLKKTIRESPEMIYTVRTKSGKHLRVTKDHRILTDNGFKRLSELKINDLVAVERRVNFWEQFDDEKLDKIKSNISKKTRETWENSSKEERDQKRSGFIKYQKSGRMNEIAKKTWNAYDNETKERLTTNLIESGKKSIRGYQTRFVGFATDGHKVFSRGELLVDDWLYLHKIPHEKEVRVGSKIRRERADFKAFGLYIEFDGLNRPDSYFEKKFGDEPYIVIRGIKEIDSCLSELLEPERALNGKEIIFEPITNISEWKTRDTVYDIEMEEDPHNFLANGIVVHNSKTYYPNEFIASCLTLGDKTKNIEYIREARRLGLKINLPKIGVSHAIKWNCDKKGNLFAPFISINGVGDIVAEKIAKAKVTTNKAKKGFFSSAPTEKIPGVNKNVIAILNQIKAFDPEYVTTKEDLKKYKHLFIF